MAAVLRAGLLGIGMMGRHHARVLSSLDGVELVAVADARGDVHRVAPGLPGLPVLTNVEALIDARVDMCIVALPTKLHVNAGVQLAEAGVHTLIEKPLAADLPGARRLTDAFRLAGLVGCVGYVERFNPALLALRARLDHGLLGEVYQVVTRRQGPFPHRISDVGVVKDLATHDFDLTAWVTRQPYRTVSAHTAHKSGRPHEDLVAAVAQLADGTVAMHLVNWLSPLKERVTVVTGERGTYVADMLTADLTLYENGIVPTEWDHIARFRGVSEGDVTRYAIPKPEPLRTELEAFRDAVLGRGGNVVTMDEGQQAIATTEAVLESARTGRTVEVGHLLEEAAHLVGAGRA